MLLNPTDLLPGIAKDSMPKAFPLRPLAAEFVGTFLLVFVATGVIMANEISGGQITHLGIGLSTGLAVAVIIFALGHVSGAHINPAVTFGFALGGHLPWRKVPGYVAAQMAGGIFASAVLLALLGSLAHQGANLPAVGASQALGLEVVLTFLLMLVIVAVATDSKAQGQLAALAIGATVALEIIFAGTLSGSSMNPARSLSPALIGWTWTSQWIYVVGPVAGAAIAVIFYGWLREDDE